MEGRPGGLREVARPGEARDDDDGPGLKLAAVRPHDAGLLVDAGDARVQPYVETLGEQARQRAHPAARESGCARREEAEEPRREPGRVLPSRSHTTPDRKGSTTLRGSEPVKPAASNAAARVVSLPRQEDAANRPSRATS